MTQVTLKNMAKFQAELVNYPTTMTAPKEIRDGEGNLKDAAVILAIRVKQQPNLANAEWLDNLAKKMPRCCLQERI